MHEKRLFISRYKHVCITEIGAPVRSNLFYLICSGHLIRSIAKKHISSVCATCPELPYNFECSLLTSPNGYMLAKRSNNTKTPFSNKSTNKRTENQRILINLRGGWSGRDRTPLLRARLTQLQSD